MLKFHGEDNIFIREIRLKVLDIERSMEFYTKIMGLKILESKKKEIRFTADGINPILTIIKPSDVVPKIPRRTGLYHFALLLPSRKDLGLFLNHIKGNDYPIIGGSNHGVSEAVYLQDPDDNGIEVYVDTDSNLWKGKDNQIVMATDPLDFNSVIDEAGEARWTEIPKNTIIGHIHLHVGDLEKAKNFYCDGLGFDLVMKMSNSALFLSSGGYHHHIGLNIWNGINAPALPDNSAGLEYYTLVFPDGLTRENSITNLKQMGYDIFEKDSHVFTKDPSNNLIELTVFQ
ncbi:MAG: VOC family protein [Tissierellia bacterium]|nr:VOC family protein [Tissierellia bacterium]